MPRPKKTNATKASTKVTGAVKKAAVAPPETSGQGYEQVFKNMDNVLRRDAGCTSEIDYTEQSSWILFLKYLDQLEADREQEAILTGKTYSWILSSKFRWSTWAAPKKANGERDRNLELTGDALLKFVNDELFPYLQGFKGRASSSDTIEYKIGEIFGEIRNRIASGYNLRDVIDEIDKLKFRSAGDKHELSDLYEVKIKNMGNAGRNGGEYYTPRPLIRAMIRVIQPKVGETVYDGALGSAGFLCEAFEYMSNQPGLTTSNMTTLQTKTFYGREKKPIPYVIGIMNMILHGIDAPNIWHVNTLSIPLTSIEEKDRYNVILANPPFGGKERTEVQQNFTIHTAETAYLFLQHFIKSLKAGGRAAVVIKNTFLSNTDNASVALRKMLLTECNLHTILDLPSGTFQGAGVRTVVLFFEKGSPTTKTWIYQLDPGRTMGKTTPLNDQDLSDFVELATAKATTPKSWTIKTADLDPTSLDLTVRNPTVRASEVARTPAEVLASIEQIDSLISQKVSELRGVLS